MPAVPLVPAHAKSVEKGRMLKTAALATTAWMERWFPDTFRFGARAGAGKHGSHGSKSKAACSRDYLR